MRENYVQYFVIVSIWNYSSLCHGWRNSEKQQRKENLYDILSKRSKNNLGTVRCLVVGAGLVDRVLVGFGSSKKEDGIDRVVRQGCCGGKKRMMDGIEKTKMEKCRI